MFKRTLFEKIWDEHVVLEPSDQPPLLYIDLHLVHEVTSPQAFEGLRVAGRRVRRPVVDSHSNSPHFDSLAAHRSFDYVLRIRDANISL